MLHIASSEILLVLVENLVEDEFLELKLLELLFIPDVLIILFLYQFEHL